jgi:hypothetical protein
MLWPLFARAAWAQPANLVADMTCEGAVLTSFRLVMRGPSQPLCRRARQVNSSLRICSIVLQGLSQPLRWRERQVRALFWPLFAWSKWAQATNVVVGTTVEDFALASVQSFGVCYVSLCRGKYES